MVSHHFCDTNGGGGCGVGGDGGINRSKWRWRQFWILPRCLREAAETKSIFEPKSEKSAIFSVKLISRIAKKRAPAEEKKMEKPLQQAPNRTEMLPISRDPQFFTLSPTNEYLSAEGIFSTWF